MQYLQLSIAQNYVVPGLSSIEEALQSIQRLMEEKARKRQMERVLDLQDLPKNIRISTTADPLSQRFIRDDDSQTT